MITDRLENLYRFLPDKYRVQILAWIKQVNRDIPEGRYEICGEEVFAKVLSYRTKKREGCRIEAHERYIDIQSTICGTEGILVYEKEKLKIEEGYNEENDVAFYYTSSEPFAGVDVYENCFAMLFPDEAHQPEISFDESCPIIKKFVVKIREDLYE